MRSLVQAADVPFNPPTQKQQAFMDRHRLASDRTDFFEAMYKIGSYVCSRRLLPPTARQVDILKQHGQWREGMLRGQASDLIGEIFAKGPSRPSCPTEATKR